MLHLSYYVKHIKSEYKKKGHYDELNRSQSNQNHK